VLYEFKTPGLVSPSISKIFHPFKNSTDKVVEVSEAVGVHPEGQKASSSKTLGRLASLMKNSKDKVAKLIICQVIFLIFIYIYAVSSKPTDRTPKQKKYKTRA
jgi:hypothetical protein